MLHIARSAGKKLPDASSAPDHPSGAQTATSSAPICPLFERPTRHRRPKRRRAPKGMPSTPPKRRRFCVGRLCGHRSPVEQTQGRRPGRRSPVEQMQRRRPGSRSPVGQTQRHRPRCRSPVRHRVEHRYGCRSRRRRPTCSAQRGRGPVEWAVGQKGAPRLGAGDGLATEHPARQSPGAQESRRHGA